MALGLTGCNLSEPVPEMTPCLSPIVDPCSEDNPPPDCATPTDAPTAASASHLSVVFVANGARVALVNQHHADQLDLTKTPLAWMASQFPGDGSNDHELELRSHLAIYWRR